MLLIDGQQRVSAIAGVLLQGKLASVDEVEDPGMWELWFDASDQGFKHTSSEPPPPSWIRVRDLLEIRAIMRASTDLQHTVKDEGKIQLIVEAWQAAATSLNSYRFPVVEFHTDDLSLAVESFTRLNRRGLDISPDEMFSALAGGEGKRKRLSDHIDDTLRAIRDDGFGEIDRLTVLRLILLELDLDPFRTDWNRLDEDVQDTTRGKLEQVALRAQNSLLCALRFLRSDLDLVSTRLLPYSGILVGVAAYLGARAQPLLDSDRRRLTDWCWHAAFAGFAEGNPSRATQIWRALRALGRGPVDQGPLPRISAGATPTAFPSRFDLRAARLQTSLWAAMTTWEMDTVRKDQVGRFLNTAGSQAYRRVCGSGSAASSKAFKELLSSPANRVFDEWSVDRTSSGALAGSRALAGPQIRAIDPDDPEQHDRMLRLHITEDARNRLIEGDEEAFLTLRLDRMIEDERKLMVRFGLTPPADRTPQRPAIDHLDSPGMHDDDPD